MNIFGHELKRSLRSTLIWGLIIGGTIMLCVFLFPELKKELDTVSDTMLAATLKEMINDDLVRRIQYDEIPPKVEYSLTEVGESLKPVLANICIWSRLKRGDSDCPSLNVRFQFPFSMVCIILW